MDRDDDRTQVVLPGSIPSRDAQAGDADDGGDTGGDRTQFMQPSQRAQAAARALADARATPERSSARPPLDLDLSGSDEPAPAPARGGRGLWVGIALVAAAALAAMATVLR